MITDEQKRYIANGYNNEISTNIIAIELRYVTSLCESYIMLCNNVSSMQIYIHKYVERNNSNKISV